MAAFELLTQTGGEESPRKRASGTSSDLATVLGRHALLAGDRRDQPGVTRYVEAGIEIAQSLDGDRPLATIQPLIEAVMEEENSVLPTMWTVLSLVANRRRKMSKTLRWGPFESTSSTRLASVVTRPRVSLPPPPSPTAAGEVPASGGLPWKISAHIRLYSQHECDVILIREVPHLSPFGGTPSAASPGEWVVEDRLGWKVFLVGVGGRFRPRGLAAAAEFRRPVGCARRYSESRGPQVAAPASVSVVGRS